MGGKGMDFGAGFWASEKLELANANANINYYKIKCEVMVLCCITI